MAATGSGIGTATLRCLGASDAVAVQRFHEHLDQHDSYMRWFGPQPKQLTTFSDRLCECNDQRCALGAFIGEELVGVGSYVALERVSRLRWSSPSWLRKATGCTESGLRF